MLEEESWYFLPYSIASYEELCMQRAFFFCLSFTSIFVHSAFFYPCMNILHGSRNLFIILLSHSVYKKKYLQKRSVMKEKVDIEIASEHSNHIKSSDQIKGLSWSLSPVMNCQHRVVSDTWPRAAWGLQKDFFHLLKWPIAQVPPIGYSHLML